MAESFFERPILNSPYRAPELHHPLDQNGQPVDGEPRHGRRPSRFIVPVPASRKNAAAQQTTLDLETYTDNALISNAVPNVSRTAMDRILPDLTWRDPANVDAEPPPRRTKKASVGRQRVAANPIQPTINGYLREEAIAAKQPRRKSRPDAIDKLTGPVPALGSRDNVGNGGAQAGGATEPSRERSQRARTRRADRASPPSFPRGERWKRRLPKVLW